MIIKESTWNDLRPYREALEHDGRKGMKWYQHIFGRYQSGAKYADNSSSDNGSNKKSRSEKKEEKAASKAAKETAKKETDRQKILNNPKSLYKHRNEFTYEEIKKAMDKFEWEKKLNSYVSEQNRQLKERMNNGAEYINAMFKSVNNSINLYNAVARVINTIQGDESVRYVKPMKFDKKDDNQTKDEVGKQQNSKEDEKKKKSS